MPVVFGIVPDALSLVDRAGNLVRMDLLSPFAYLKRLTDRVKREANSEGTERCLLFED